MRYWRLPAALPVLILSLILHTELAVGQNTFERRYGSDFEDYANKAIQTHNGNFIVGGTTWGFGSVSNAFLMKLDPMGGQVWTRNFPGINSDEVFDIVEQGDNGLVVCGGTFSYGAGYWDGFVMKTDSLGNMLWGHTYGNEYSDILYKIKDDKAGGYFTAGYVQQASDSYHPGTVLMRLDPQGGILWSKWLPWAWDAQGAGWVPIDMAVTATGEVLLTTVHGGWTLDLWKFSADGQLLWNKTFGQEAQGQRLAVDVDGNVYITCFRPLGDGNFSIDVSVLKLDSNGNVEWCKSYGGTYIEFARAITAPNTGGVAVAGYTNSSGQGGYDAFLLRLDADGSLLWGKTFGTVWDEVPNSIEPTSDGGFVLAGQTYSYGSNPDSLKVYVVKTDEDGNTDCSSLPWSPTVLNDSLSMETTTITPSPYAMQVGTLAWPSDPVILRPASICSNVSVQDLQNDDQRLSVHPNPFSDRVVVTIRGSGGERLKLSVRDMLGRVVYQVKDQVIFHNGENELDLGRLQSGVYTLELVLGNEKEAVKLIKQ